MAVENRGKLYKRLAWFLGWSINGLEWVLSTVVNLQPQKLVLFTLKVILIQWTNLLSRLNWRAATEWPTWGLRPLFLCGLSILLMALLISSPMLEVLTWPDQPFSQQIRYKEDKYNISKPAFDGNRWNCVSLGFWTKNTHMIRLNRKRSLIVDAGFKVELRVGGKAGKVEA